MNINIKAISAAVLAAAALSGVAAVGPTALKAPATAPAFPEPVTTVRGVMV